MENAQQCSNVSATVANPVLKDPAKPGLSEASPSSSASTPSTLELLSNLHLRKIIKENHGSAINGLVLNRFDDKNAHMVVTSG